MTPEEAKQALELVNDAPMGASESRIGFWCYVIRNLDNQQGGKVLHFWPNDSRRTYVKYMIELQNYTSVCDLDTGNGKWELPWNDLYFRERLPRCKRCVKRLTQLATGVRR